MNKKTLKALRGSIEKWQAVADGTCADNGDRNCPLCHDFLKYDCIGCPVREATGQGLCSGTPYEAWGSLRFDERRLESPDGWFVRSDESFRLARGEEMFLRALWPAGANL